MDLIVTIVRHGNTFGPNEAPRRIGARTDLPLVPSGHEQAHALGRAFAEQDRRFDRALAAMLTRTQATMADILAHQAHVPIVESAHWLKEIDHGPDEGQIEDEVVNRIGPEALAAWDVQARAPDGWIVDADQRIRGWQELLRVGKGQVLIVTSNGAARFALLSDPALARQAAGLPSLKLRTGAYGVIVRERDELQLLAWDQRP